MKIFLSNLALLRRFFFLCNSLKIAACGRSVVQEVSLEKKEEKPVMQILFCAELLGREQASPW